MIHPRIPGKLWKNFASFKFTNSNTKCQSWVFLTLVICNLEMLKSIAKFLEILTKK